MILSCGTDDPYSGDRELILMYPLPDSAQRIASLCSEVLAFGYGVADDEPLLFTLIQYP